MTTPCPNCADLAEDRDLIRRVLIRCTEELARLRTENDELRAKDTFIRGMEGQG